MPEQRSLEEISRGVQALVRLAEQGSDTRALREHDIKTDGRLDLIIQQAHADRAVFTKAVDDLGKMFKEFAHSVDEKFKALTTDVGSLRDSRATTDVRMAISGKLGWTLVGIGTTGTLSLIVWAILKVAA
jgi:hypothetical protein